MSDIIKPGTIIEDPKTGVRKMCISVNTHSNHDANSYDEKYTEYIWRKLPFTGYGEGGGNLTKKTFGKNGTYKPGDFSSISVGTTITFKDNYTAEELKSWYESIDANNASIEILVSDSEGFAMLKPVVGANNYLLSIFNIQDWSGCTYILDYSTYTSQAWANNITEETFIPGWYTFSETEDKLCNAPSITLMLEEAVNVFCISEPFIIYDKIVYDGWSEVTVDVPTPPGEWGLYIAPDGLQFIYGFSEDGKDLYVMGTGALTCSDFYCTEVPWKKHEQVQTVERIIIGSGITDYPWYAFDQSLIVTKNQ